MTHFCPNHQKNENVFPRSVRIITAFSVEKFVCSPLLMRLTLLCSYPPWSVKFLSWGADRRLIENLESNENVWNMRPKKPVFSALFDNSAFEFLNMVVNSSFFGEGAHFSDLWRSGSYHFIVNDLKICWSKTDVGRYNKKSTNSPSSGKHVSNKICCFNYSLWIIIHYE